MGGKYLSQRGHHILEFSEDFVDHGQQRFVLSIPAQMWVFAGIGGALEVVTKGTVTKGTLCLQEYVGRGACRNMWGVVFDYVGTGLYYHQCRVRSGN